MTHEIDEDIYDELFGYDEKPLPKWQPEPLSVYLIGIIAFMVGFALCFLIFIP